MKTKLLVLAAVLLATAARADAGQVNWPDLVDQTAQTYEDPYRDLTYDQIDTLRIILETREQLAAKDQAPEARQALEAKLSKAVGTLAAEGIDADWLIEQRWIVAERRKRAATAGNPAVDGQIVALAGFAIPAPPDPDGTRVAYLVPERGMCSHTPPPNANQMIRVRLTDDWAPRYIHEPVRVTGRLDIAPSAQAMHVVDGMVSMRATFQMEVRHVETVKDMRRLGGEDRTKAWAEGIAKRFRARNTQLSE